MIFSNGFGRKGFGKFKREASQGAATTVAFLPRVPWRESELGKFERAIPRYQKVLFYTLLAGIALMAFFLVYERTQAREKLAAQSDATPLSAPVSADAESFTFDMANDGDGSVTAEQRQVALPAEASVRARALLERLVAEYALPKSRHPLASGAAVDDVFLLKLPIQIPTADALSGPVDTSEYGELAVVNLRSSFVNQHPSGMAVEMLTVLSIIGTLHANFSEITQVRFVVDGQPRETLAGHVDLTRVYPAADTAVSASQLQPTGGSQ